MTGSSDMVMSIDNERKWTVPPVKEGNFPVPHYWVMQNIRPLKNVLHFLFIIYKSIHINSTVQLVSFLKLILDNLNYDSIIHERALYLLVLFNYYTTIWSAEGDKTLQLCSSIIHYWSSTNQSCISIIRII